MVVSITNVLRVGVALVMGALLVTAGCNSSNKMDDMRTLSLSFNGLEDLGNNYEYEGWLIVGGQPLSTGRFWVDATGTPSQTAFQFNAADVDGATKFVLTIEPKVGDDPAPADTHILAGDFAGANAALSVGDGAALGTEFTAASGPFILNTPSTSSDDTDFNQGIWWLDPTAGPGPTLDLPTLPAGWMYEGWVVVDGTPYTTGKFTSDSGEDSDGAGPTGGPDGTPPFPGQDYITPPLDLHGGTAVISVEPDPDNSEGPFTLKPLVGAIPGALAIGILSPMDNNAAATNPTGTATLN